MNEKWIFVIFVFLSAYTAQAKSLCVAYSNYTPLPSWYADLCTKGDRSGEKIGGGYSTFGDAFNLNPAAIFAGKFPLGVEYVQAFRGSGLKNSFALLKGFNHIGTALTTNSDETFYGNSVFQAPSGQGVYTLTGNSSGNNSNTGKNQSPTLTLGKSIDIGSFFTKKGSFVSDLIPTLGVMAKYNSTTRSTTPGYGLAWKLWRFSLGYSHSRDPANATSPEVEYDTFTLGFNTSWFKLEAVSIRSKSVPTWIIVVQQNGSITLQQDDRSLRPVTFYTVSSNIFGFLVTVAVRSYQDVLGVSHTQYHFALQYQVTAHIGVEYLHNYVMDHSSLGLQVML